MEMTELWKANIRLSTAPCESRRRREIPTFPQLRRRVVLLERKRTQKEKTEGRLHKKLDTAAILASLTSTCRRHEIDPQLYLTRLLVNLPSWPARDLDAWLPYQWKLRQAARLDTD